jgi:hypothetical protein
MNWISSINNKVDKEAGTKVFLARKKRTIMACAYIPIRKYTSLSLPVQGRQLFVSNLTVSTLPRAAGEPPRVSALRGLTDAFPPAGVYVYFRI